MSSFIHSIIRRRVLSSRLSALVLLFQRSPLVQMLFPEARVLGGAGLGEITKWTVATIAGLGAYDTVAGATTIAEVLPVASSSSVPAAVGSNLFFTFQCTGAPGNPKSWSVTTLPAGLVHANATANPDSITGVPTTAGSYSVTVRAWQGSGNTGGSFSKTFTVSVDSAIITTQPSSLTINSGETTTLTVVGALGTGNALAYQWYSGVSPSTTTPISGATAASYTTPALSAAANYWVKVTRRGVVATPSANTAYTVLANSSTAAVSIANNVAVASSIATNPASTTINSGATTTLSVVASGTAPFTYQWYEGASGTTTTPVGNNSASFTTPSLSGTTSYWVKVTNVANVAGASSTAATVTVNQPSAIATNPASTTINSGVTTTLSVVASGTAPFTYQWYEGASGTTTTPVGNNSSSFTTPTLSGTTSYWVKVTNVANVAGVSSAAATVTVNQPAAATLSNIVLSSGILSPVFTSGTMSYTESVANTVSSITITPTLADSSAVVKVNGATTTSGTACGPIPLTVGINTIDVLVTSQDGMTTNTYTAVVTRAASAIATLSNLVLSADTLSPGFTPGTTSYTASVANTVSSITVTPTLADSSAVVKVNGTTTTSSSASGPIPLTVGANTIDVLVTAEDGTTTKTYTAVVTRAALATSTLSNCVLSSGTLSPAFASQTTSYETRVGNAISTLMITPAVTSVGSTVKVNGVTVTNGTASAAIPLAVGTTNISVVVASQDGATTTTYTIGVSRAPVLLKLALSSGTLSPAFSAATTSYTASVLNNISTIKVTPTVSNVGSTIQLNGVAVASGVASAAIPLSVGNNPITLSITSPDGTTTSTYTLDVTRAPSVVATLSGLALSNGTLSPVFSSAKTAYTASVPNAISSIFVTPTLTNNTAVVKVNGTIVTSGSGSNLIPLNVGNNTINIQVTAQNGTTTKTYTMTVKRLSNVSTLSGLVLSSGTLDTAFASDVKSYTANVGNAVTTLKVTPALAGAGSIVKVNGKAVVNGAASAAIPLAVATTNISVVVMSQDGTTTTTYTIGVKRAPALSKLVLSGGTLSPAFAAATTSYTASVLTGVSTIKVTPTVASAGSTIKVNGVSVASGAASSAIPLSVGSNTITVSITSPDGTTNASYSVVVTVPGITVMRIASLAENPQPESLSTGSDFYSGTRVGDYFVFSFDRMSFSLKNADQVFQHSSDYATWDDVPLEESDDRVDLGEVDYEGKQEVTVTLPAGDDLEMVGRLR